MAQSFFKSITDRILAALAQATPPEPVAPEPPPPPPKSPGFTYRNYGKEWADDPSLAWPYLKHKNGYRRQEALDALVGPITSTTQLIAVAQRLNDWVPEVREAATRAAARLFPTASAEMVEEAAPYLMGRWRDWRRWELSGQEAMSAILNRPEVIGSILRRLETSPTGPNARHLKSLLELPWIDAELPRLWRNARQPSVRKLVFETLLNGEVRWNMGRRDVYDRYAIQKWEEVVETRKLTIAVDLLPLVEEGLRDKIGRIRWIAAGALVENKVDLPNIEAAIERLLVDEKSTVRERGAFLARRHGIPVPPSPKTL